MEAKWTQAIARAGVDVERLFSDRGDVRIKGRAPPARGAGEGRPPDDAPQAARDPGDAVDRPE